MQQLLTKVPLFENTGAKRLNRVPLPINSQLTLRSAFGSKNMQQHFLSFESGELQKRKTDHSSHCCAPGPINALSGIKGPTGMYCSSINCSFASGSVSITARASSSVLASTRKTTPLPSPREYHSRIFPSR